MASKNAMFIASIIYRVYIYIYMCKLDLKDFSIPLQKLSREKIRFKWGTSLSRFVACVYKCKICALSYCFMSAKLLTVSCVKATSDSC